jgi:hypothetical protein
MKKSFVFILGSHNDMDNISPIAWKMAKTGHESRIIFLDRNSNIDAALDPRLKFLKKDAGVRIDYFYALPESSLRLPNRPLLKSANPLLVKILRMFLGWMNRFVWTDAWAEQTLKKMNPAVCIAVLLVHADTMEGKFVRAAIRLGIPVLGASHGPSVYTNADQNVASPRPFRTAQMGTEIKKGYTPVIA